MLLLKVPINPYGKAKKMSEDVILDFSKTSKMAVMILRFASRLLFYFCITNIIFRLLTVVHI